MPTAAFPSSTPFTSQLTDWSANPATVAEKVTLSPVLRETTVGEMLTVPGEMVT